MTTCDILVHGSPRSISSTATDHQGLFTLSQRSPCTQASVHKFGIVTYCCYFWVLRVNDQLGQSLKNFKTKMIELRLNSNVVHVHSIIIKLNSFSQYGFQLVTKLSYLFWDSVTFRAIIIHELYLYMFIYLVR